MTVKKITKIIACFLLTMVAISILVPTAFAAVYINDWYLVNKNKHLIYQGTSKYMNHVEIACGLWNNYKSGVIKKKGFFDTADVNIADIDEDSDSAGHTIRYASGKGKIELNLKYMDSNEYANNNGLRTITAAHELGHALGLAHGSSPGDIMYFRVVGQPILSRNDEESYDASYARF